MPQPRPAFRVLGVPVYIPGSALIGLALVSWFALPAAQLLAADALTVWMIALLHGLVVYVAVFVHELGHVLAGKRFNYASPGVVVHVWGGHTTFARQFERASHQFWIAVAGPLGTALMAALGYLVFRNSSGLIASLGAWLAWAGGLMAIINLLPGSPLDGGAALSALVWAVTKSPLKGRIAAGVGGLLVAGLWMTSPWWLSWRFGYRIDAVDVMIAAIVGAYLASNAWAMIVTAGWRGATALTTTDFSGPDPVLSAASEQAAADTSYPAVATITRRAISVPAGTDCATAMDLASRAGAGAIVVTRDALPIGIVRDSSLGAVPAERLAQVAIEETARRVTEHDRIPMDSSLMQLGPWLSLPGADEWLVVDSSQLIYGVLIRADWNDWRRSQSG